MDACGECGFDYDEVAAPNAGAAVLDAATELAALLRDRPDDSRTRREREAWSPLEYGAHLRDVLLVQRERVLAARRTDRPTCGPMGRDERVIHDGYADQDPREVADQIDMAAGLLAHTLSRLAGTEEWSRTVFYTYPGPAERSLCWLAVHTVHEARHHLLDARRRLG